MKGTNHIKFAIGSAVAYSVMTGNIKMLPVAIPVVAVSSLLVDIDSPKSKMNKLLKYTAGVSAVILSLIYLVDKSIFDNLKTMAHQNTTVTFGIGLFLVALYLGKTAGHRKFTHRITGTSMFLVSVYFISPVLLTWFAIGYLSHIVGDSFTTAKVEFLAPFIPVKLGLGLFKSGSAQEELFIIGYSVLVAAYFFVKVSGMIR